MSFWHATIARSAGTAFGPDLFSSDAVSTPFAHRERAQFAHRERAQRAKEAIMRVLMRPAAAILLLAGGFLFPQQTLRSNRLHPVSPSRRRTSRTKSLTRRQPPSSGWPASSRTINSG